MTKNVGRPRSNNQSRTIVLTPQTCEEITQLSSGDEAKFISQLVELGLRQFKIDSVAALDYELKKTQIRNAQLISKKLNQRLGTMNDALVVLEKKVNGESVSLEELHDAIKIMKECLSD